jgi:N-acetylglucosaminyldiphosphoundecaprenol N-acetyl-beta-D-mannosaminyltransferase
MLNEPREHLIATVNSEFIVAAQHDRDFLELLQKTDLNLPDGHGVLLAARLQGDRLPERVTGVDFTVDLCGLCAELGLPVFFLGGERRNVAERAAAAMRARFPGLSISAHEGGQVRKDEQGRLRCSAEAMATAREARAAVILVAFSHGRQEKWCRDNAPDLPDARLLMGVGGTFDFLAGDVRRAPAIFRSFHAEWLWRLLLEPRRWRRIWTATFVFQYLAAKARYAKIKA